MKKTVLLLNPPAEGLYIRDFYCSFTSKAYYYWPPQDLLLLSGRLKNDFNIEVFDGIMEPSHEKLYDKIKKIHPYAIIFTTGTATIKSDLKLLKTIKNIYKNITLIATSGIFYYMNNKIFLQKNSFIDAVIKNPAAKDIIDFLKKGKAANNIVFRNKSKIIEKKFTFEHNFTLPVPQHELFPYKKYYIPTVDSLPFTIAISSMGCPYQCQFCTIANFPYFTRDIKNFVEEIKHIYSLNIKSLVFQDPNFTISYNRIKEFNNLLKKNNIKIKYVCNATANILANEKTVKLLKESGCSLVMIGVESGSDRILKKYKKPATKDQMKKAFKLCHKYKIKTLGYFIIGFPVETKADIISTINFAKKLKPYFASFSFASPDFGSPISKDYIDYNDFSSGKLSWDRTDQLKFSNLNLSKKEISSLKRKAIISFYLNPSYIIRMITRLRDIKLIKIFFINAYYILFKKHRSKK